MSRIIKTVQLLRRNWKKSTFLFGVIAYGSSYGVDRYKTFQMMRAYCEEARKYGEIPLPTMEKPKHITVILNPEANYRKSNIQFEKFAAPLLHLAGFKVSMFQTEKAKQAGDLMQVMSNTDAVLVAGGDGTLHEAVTGLLSRPNIEEENLPLGIVPLGKTNTVAHYLFGSKSSSNAQLMAEAVMAVIRNTTTMLDVLKIKYQDEDQPVYAVSCFEQGMLADVDLLVEKYWYLGALKDKFTYFVNSLKDKQNIEIESLEYVAPCDGCSRCYVPSRRKENLEQARRWWSSFVPKTESKELKAALEKDRLIANTVNENCGTHLRLDPTYSNLCITTNSADSKHSEKPNSLWVKIFPENLSMTQFISAGLSHRQFKHQDPTGTATIVNAREVIIRTEKPEHVESDSHQVVVVVTNSASSNNTISLTPVKNSNSVLGVPAELITINSEQSDTSNQPELSAEGLPEAGTPTTADTSEINSADASEEATDEKSDQKKEFYSYIDKEKYKRGPCSITLLPKKITVYA